AQEYCSAEWQKMKNAGKTFQGQTWPKFWSQCSKDYAAKNPDAAAGAGDAATTTEAETPAKKKATKTAAVDERDTTSSGAEKKACDAKWTAYKAKSGAHGWHDYFQFMAKCM